MHARILIKLAFGLVLTMIAPPLCAQLDDVNADGQVTIVDALFIARYYVGIIPSVFIPERADVDCSGRIDIVDALLVTRYSVGSINEFLACIATSEPAATVGPMITSAPGECEPCVQTTVPPELQIDPIANPSEPPVLTPHPTLDTNREGFYGPSGV